MTRPTVTELLPADATVIYDLICEFGRIVPMVPDLNGLGAFVFNSAPVMTLNGLRRALSRTTLTERILLARFVLTYGTPDSVAGGKPGVEACKDLISKAEDILTMLGLAELTVSSLKVTDLDEIERIGNQMSAGNPQEIGLWLAYVAVRDLTTSFGYPHYFIQLALAVYQNRDGPDLAVRATAHASDRAAERAADRAAGKPY